MGNSTIQDVCKCIDMVDSNLNSIEIFPNNYNNNIPHSA